MSPRPILPGIQPHGPGEPDDRLLREVLGHWATGVAVLAVRDEDGEIDAITVSAFTPVSLRPPLVLVCIGEQVSTLTTLLDAGWFALSILPQDAARTAGIAASRSAADQLPFPAAGDPVLPGAIASLVCRVADTHPGGDHRIVLGQVERAELGRDAGPLLYYRRDYRALREGKW